jgi:hypothetical protein
VKAAHRKSNRLGRPQIAGVVICVVLVIAILLVVMLLIYLRRRKRMAKPIEEYPQRSVGSDVMQVMRREEGGARQTT